MQELTEMLGFRPYRFYFYMWKFVSPLFMAVLTTASIIQLGVSPPGYSAWIKEEVSGGPTNPGITRSFSGLYRSRQSEQTFLGQQLRDRSCQGPCIPNVQSE